MKKRKRKSNKHEVLKKKAYEGIFTPCSQTGYSVKIHQKNIQQEETER
jgi:hypothetical protein